MARLPAMRIEARITLGLVAIFLSLLMLLDVVFGLLPDRADVELQSRQRSAYSLAVLLTHALGNGSGAVPREAVSALVQRDGHMLSVALRKPDGALTPIVGNHAAHWALAEGARSTLTNVRVPLLDGQRLWGHLEIAFRPVYASTLAGWLADSATSSRTNGRGLRISRTAARSKITTARWISS